MTDPVAFDSYAKKIQYLGRFIHLLSARLEQIKQFTKLINHVQLQYIPKYRKLDQNISNLSVRFWRCIL